MSKRIDLILGLWLTGLIALYAGAIHYSISQACSDKELRDAACWALCRQDEFSSGHYIEKTRECACVVLRPYKQATEVQLKIHSQPKDRLDY